MKTTWTTITHNHHTQRLSVTLADGRCGWPTATSHAQDRLPPGYQLRPAHRDGPTFVFTCHPGLTLTRNQLEAWAGRPLTEQDVASLTEALPHSSIPEAIGTIADNLPTAQNPKPNAPTGKGTQPGN